jgi:hypothetical protein
MVWHSLVGKRAKKKARLGGRAFRDSGGFCRNRLHADPPEVPGIIGIGVIVGGGADHGSTKT